MPSNTPRPEKEKAHAKRGKGIYATALFLFLSGVGYLVFTGVVENRTYFLNVAEALHMPHDTSQAVRLFGTVKGEGISRAVGGLGVRFQLEDKDDAAKTLWVRYQGAVPDSFRAGAEVIVEGGFAPAALDFQARTLMTKCPSKYQKENRG